MVRSENVSSYGRQSHKVYNERKRCTLGSLWVYHGVGVNPAEDKETVLYIRSVSV